MLPDGDWLLSLRLTFDTGRLSVYRHLWLRNDKKEKFLDRSSSEHVYIASRRAQTFVLKDHIKLRLKDQEVSIDKATSKHIYGEIRSKYETTPTAQAKYTEQYPNVCLEWKEIYNLPFKVLKDTKSREFQCKILHRYLTTNAFSQNWFDSFTIMYFLWCREQVPRTFIDHMSIH